MPYFGYTRVDADSITMMAAGALNLEGQSPWTYYNTPDAPEGAWITYGHDPITATITLPQSLVGGTTYYIFIYFGDYDVHRNVYCTCGGGTSDTIITDDRDFNTYWSTRMTLTPNSSSSTLIFNIGGNITQDASRLFRGIYITTNVNVTVTKEGQAINLTFPIVMDDSAAIKGNLIANGSFESGIDGSWGLYGSHDYSLASLWNNTTGHSGTACLKISLDASTLLAFGSELKLRSKVYRLKPNKTYTFSAWAKCESGSPLLVIRAINSFTPPAGYTGQYILSETLNLSTTWQRVSLTGYMKAYPTSDFQFEFNITSPSAGNFLYIDDVQLEEGSLTDYAPSHTLETLIMIDEAARPGHIYYSTDSLTATLRAYNSSGSSITKTLKYAIYNYLNQLVRSDSTSLTVGAGIVQSTSFDISTTGMLGVFRLVYWLNAEDGTEKELNYSIIPAPPAGTDVTSYMGVHPNFTVYPLAAYKRLGMKWARDLSPAAITRWEVTEPTDNNYVWRDAEVAACVAQGIEPLMTLGTVLPFANLPAFMKSGAFFDLAQWSSYVTTVVNHYKASVHYWEIWNEPLAMYTADQYAQLLKTAVDAIEAEDATAKIVGMGGLNATSINAVLTSLASLYPSWTWTDHMDAISTHCYPDGTNPFDLTTYVTTNNMPVWNTETGDKTLGPFVGPYSNWVAWGKQILPFYDAQRFYREFVNGPAKVVSNFASSLAAKLTKYFYYDGRITAWPGEFLHEYTLLQHDGSMRTKAIAYSVAGYFLDHAVGQGEVSTDANSAFYPYSTTGDPVAVLYSTDRKSRQVVLSGVTNSQLAVYDVMGNPVTFSGTTVKYGRLPVYVKGIGISLATLSSALSGGTVSLVSDTLAPAVSIVAGPVEGSSAAATFRMRWLALDDISLPNFGEFNTEQLTPGDDPAPDAILYSYRLIGQFDWSTWVADTYRDYVSIAPGQYVFEVKAKDAAGNESPSAARAIVVGGSTRRVLLSLN